MTLRREKNYGIGSNKRKWIDAGVDARIHDLRHTTGSRTLRKTGNLKVVQTLLGHSTIAITADFYANVTVEDVCAAMEATGAAEPAERPRSSRKRKARNNAADILDKQVRLTDHAVSSAQLSFANCANLKSLLRASWASISEIVDVIPCAASSRQ